MSPAAEDRAYLRHRTTCRKCQPNKQCARGWKLFLRWAMTGR